MVDIKRGGIYFCDLEPTKGNEQQGHRPVVILSSKHFNKHSGTVIAMSLTSQEQKAPFPLTFQLKNKNIPKKAWVKISQIRTLSTERLGKYVAKIAPEQIEKIIEGLNEIIGYE